MKMERSPTRSASRLLERWAIWVSSRHLMYGAYVLLTVSPMAVDVTGHYTAPHISLLRDVAAGDDVAGVDDALAEVAFDVLFGSVMVIIEVITPLP